MTHATAILEALERSNQSMTCTKIARISGVRNVLVYNYIRRLCKAGSVSCVKTDRPREYQRAHVGADEIVKSATATQPKWVFDLGGAV